MGVQQPSISTAEERFSFGENWQRFLLRLDEAAILRAEASLRSLLGRDRLDRLTFLDIGSGSGLLSLAAWRLGAHVRSFDYDLRSVACTASLKARYAPADAEWSVERGSILDRGYVTKLGRFDLVYSWGVLHHTGEMWRAIEMACSCVAADGVLALAIYNDQGRRSRYWARVKRLYNCLPERLRFLVLWPTALRLWGPTVLRDTARGDPLRSWRSYGAERGMSPWRDVVDWVGGWPFEVATPEAVFDFCRERGFILERLRTCGGGLGCNEFVFRRAAVGASGDKIPPAALPHGECEASDSTASVASTMLSTEN